MSWGQRVFVVLGVACGALTVQVQATRAADLSISESTKFYSISGKTALDFALAMGKRGPRAYNRRAWATTSRTMTYQLVRNKTRGKCKLSKAKVKVKILYTMPKPASMRNVSKRDRSKWKQMYALLNKHERTHGLYYRQYAKQIQKSLRGLSPASSCRTLDKNAAALVKKINERVKRKNIRFDETDVRTYRRMERIYTSR